MLRSVHTANIALRYLHCVGTLHPSTWKLCTTYPHCGVTRTLNELECGSENKLKMR